MLIDTKNQKTMDQVNKTDKKSSQASQIADLLKKSNNILVTISKNPSVDQLTACLGLTLALNKADKHASAVFSGEIPELINFLEPDKTIEKNTDSLRDFIISLDKSKADKLRYKVEDNVVRIFITPYKTSISDQDLEFSQGDFNIDAVVALDVQNRGDLDEAILAHGRILHDAQIVSLSKSNPSELGTTEWLDTSASSISEMVSDLIIAMDKKLLDSQNSTALLTGIVNETDRFRNEKSTPHTMTISGVLMTAGASTQLVSEKLEEGQAIPEEIKEELPAEEASVDESAIQIPDEHAEIPEPQDEEEPVSDENDNQEEQPHKNKAPEGVIEIEHPDDQITINEDGQLQKIADILAVEEERKQAEEKRLADEEQTRQQAEAEAQKAAQQSQENNSTPDQNIEPQGMVYHPPTFGGQLTANSTAVDQQYSSMPDPTLAMSGGQGQNGILTHQSNQTLSDLEKSINSPHANQYPDGAPTGAPSFKGKTIEPIAPILGDNPVNNMPSEEYAKEAVERAIAGSTDYRPEPIQALGASPAMEVSHVASNPNPAGPPPPPVPPPMMPQ